MKIEFFVYILARGVDYVQKSRYLEFTFFLDSRSSTPAKRKYLQSLSIIPATELCRVKRNGEMENGKQKMEVVKCFSDFCCAYISREEDFSAACKAECCHSSFTDRSFTICQIVHCVCFSTHKIYFLLTLGFTLAWLAFDHNYRHLATQEHYYHKCRT